MAEEVDGLGQVAGPAVGVTHLGAADRQDVVHRVRRVLRRAQRLEVWEVEVHLRRRLGAWGDLEHHRDAVDHQLLAGRTDLVGRGDQGRLTEGVRLAEPRADLTVGGLGQGGAVHVDGPSRHRRSGVDVLGDGSLHEALRGDDLGATSVDVLLRDDALDAAEVVDVAVRVDDRHDRPVAPVRSVEGEGCRGCLPADERVDHDDAGVAFDHAHHRDVEAAQLVDAVDDLEEPVLGQQLPLTPEAGAGGLWHVCGQEAVGVEVPDEVTVVGDDLTVLRPCDEASLGVVEVGGVRQRK